MKFLKHYPPSKATLPRNIPKYQLNGTSLILKKGTSGSCVTDRTAENIQVAQEPLEVNNGRLSVRRNGLVISASSFCRITKKDLRWHSYKIFNRH